MADTAKARPLRADRDVHRFVLLALALCLSYLCVAASLPVISVFVTQRLRFGNAAAGLAVGIAFASTILTRGWAGSLADTRGSKSCMVQGLVAYTVAALVCDAASLGGLPPHLAYGLLIVGRLLLGVGESLATVGLIAWSFGIMGAKRSGLVFGLVGTALYAAFAVGSPIGMALFAWGGFGSVMAACALFPVVGLAMIAPVGSVAPQAGNRQPFWRIIGRIWEPGLALALAGVGSATIGAFVPVYFLNRGWPHAELALTCFGGGFVLARILFGHLPDRLGAMPVALASIAVEIIGRCLLWTASDPTMALSGTLLTGLGCSLMFPTMGVEVVQRVAPNLRGTAAGALAAFQDLAFGLTGPTTGLLADRFGLGVVFLVGSLAAAVGLALIVAMARSHRRLSA